MDFKNHLRNTFGGGSSVFSSQKSQQQKTTTAAFNPAVQQTQHKQQQSIRNNEVVQNSPQLQIVNSKQATAILSSQKTQSVQKTPAVILDQQGVNSKRSSAIIPFQMANMLGGADSQQQQQTNLNQRIKELERQVHLAKQENDDLRVNLKINKESLQALLEQKDPQEKALIQTINVISSENLKLTMQIERMKQDNENLKTTIIVQTGRHQQQQSHRQHQSYSDVGINTSFHEVVTNKSSQNSSMKKSIKPKGNNTSATNATLFWEKEEAFRENERAMKKLMVECARLQAFMKALLENYSLPENLQEDIRELVYEQEMTQYDQNNEFFAQLPPLSPIGESSRVTLSLAFGQESNIIKGSNHQQQQQPPPKPKMQNFNIPKLDLTKIKPEFFFDEVVPNEQIQPIINNWNDPPVLNSSSLIVKDDSNLLDDNGMELNDLLYNNPALMMSTDRIQNQQRSNKKEDPSNTQALRDELAELEYGDEGIEDQLVDEGGQFIYGTSGAVFSDADIFESKHQTQDEEFKGNYNNRQDTLDLDSNPGEFYDPDNQQIADSNRLQNDNNGYYFYGPQSTPSKSDRFRDLDFHS